MCPGAKVPRGKSAQSSQGPKQPGAKAPKGQSAQRPKAPRGMRLLGGQNGPGGRKRPGAGLDYRPQLAQYFFLQPMLKVLFVFLGVPVTLTGTRNCLGLKSALINVKLSNIGRLDKALKKAISFPLLAAMKF
jgi:hypothetical protein